MIDSQIITSHDIQFPRNTADSLELLSILLSIPTSKSTNRLGTRTILSMPRHPPRFSPPFFKSAVSGSPRRKSAENKRSPAISMPASSPSPFGFDSTAISGSVLKLGAVQTRGQRTATKRPLETHLSGAIKDAATENDATGCDCFVSFLPPPPSLCWLIPVATPSGWTIMREKPYKYKLWRSIGRGTKLNGGVVYELSIARERIRFVIIMYILLII